MTVVALRICRSNNSGGWAFLTTAQEFAAFALNARFRLQRRAVQVREVAFVGLASWRSCKSAVERQVSNALPTDSRQQSNVGIGRRAACCH